FHFDDKAEALDSDLGWAEPLPVAATLKVQKGSVVGARWEGCKEDKVQVPRELAVALHSRNELDRGLRVVVYPRPSVKDHLAELLSRIRLGAFGTSTYPNHAKHLQLTPPAIITTLGRCGG